MVWSEEQSYALPSQSLCAQCSIYIHLNVPVTWQWRQRQKLGTLLCQPLDHVETLRLLPELVSRNLHKWMMKARETVFIFIYGDFHFNIVN